MVPKSLRLPWGEELVLAAHSQPTFPISGCGCPKNPPSFTTVMVGASTNAVNYPIGLTKPSLGAGLAP